MLDGPLLYAWMQDSVPPSTSYEERPGRWVDEPHWPSLHIKDQDLPLAPHQLAAPGEEVPVRRLDIQTPLKVGQRKYRR